MSAHTPGPWQQSNLLVLDAKGNEIAHCTRWERGRPMPEVAEANARLISATHDLLSAAKTILDSYGPGSEYSSPFREQWDALAAAIAKAEGGH